MYVLFIYIWSLKVSLLEPNETGYIYIGQFSCILTSAIKVVIPDVCKLVLVV